MDRLKAVLKEDGFIVYCAGDGESGFEKALLLQPDLIVLNINMRAGSGFRMLRSLQQDENTADIPVVMIARMACVREHNAPARRTMQPNTLLLGKPNDRERFLARIHEVLQAGELESAPYIRG